MTEVMDVDYVGAVEEAADVIQIGTRNMQNFSLLQRVSRTEAGITEARHGRHVDRVADGR